MTALSCSILGLQLAAYFSSLIRRRRDSSSALRRMERQNSVCSWFGGIWLPLDAKNTKSSWRTRGSDAPLVSQFGNFPSQTSTTACSPVSAEMTSGDHCTADTEDRRRATRLIRVHLCKIAVSAALNFVPVVRTTNVCTLAHGICTRNCCIQSLPVDGKPMMSSSMLRREGIAGRLDRSSRGDCASTRMMSRVTFAARSAVSGCCAKWPRFPRFRTSSTGRTVTVDPSATCMSVLSDLARNSDARSQTSPGSTAVAWVAWVACVAWPCPIPSFLSSSEPRSTTSYVFGASG